MTRRKGIRRSSGKVTAEIASGVSGGALMGRPGRNTVVNVSYAFVKDPDGNQIELIVEAK